LESWVWELGFGILGLWGFGVLVLGSGFEVRHLSQRIKQRACTQRLLLLLLLLLLCWRRQSSE
jgi:hypothetical protein